MCGLAGILNLGDAPPPEEARLAPMAASLWHRGPDEFGLYRDAHCGLVHARLSIVDVASGQQPMASHDERHWLVFNGEIFNYIELREELILLGHRFRTQSDTEVILASWQQWGAGAFARFNGQWAIALWTPAEQTLVLARDRVGVRPLVYAEHGGRLWFASEPAALFAGAPELPRAFCPDGLAETFTFWGPLAPRTVFRSVHEVPPGAALKFVGGRAAQHARAQGRATVTVIDQWQPDFSATFTGSRDDARDALAAALARATSIRMLRADVDVGAYVSGGLDSALIATMGHAAKGPGFHTFSLRFADAEFDEGPYQQAVAHHVGSMHHEVCVTRDDIANVFPDVCRHAARPLLRTAPAPMFLLSKCVREAGVKVVLTGEGADEWFAGYDIFREAAVRRFWARAPHSKARPRLLERLYPYLARSPVERRELAMAFFGRDLASWQTPGFGHQPRWQNARALLRMLVPEMRGADVLGQWLGRVPDAVPTWRPLGQDQWFEIMTLLPSYLLSAQGDRMLMANSVEGRFPFLDRDVMALGASLPPSYKLLGLDEKHVVKRVAVGRIPDRIWQRPKQPYRAPDAAAFMGSRAAWIGEMISPETTRNAGVFAPTQVAGLWKKLQASQALQFSNADNMNLCAVLSTHLVWQQVLNAPSPPRTPLWRVQVDKTRS